MSVYGTAWDVGIANNQRIALCGSQFVEILLDGILRKTVANSQHSDDFGLRPDGAK